MRLTNILVLALLSLFMTFVRPQPCSAAYDSMRGLSLHQNACIIFTQAQMLPINARERYEAKRARKRQKLAEDAASTAAGPSVSIEESSATVDNSDAPVCLNFMQAM